MHKITKTINKTDLTLHQVSKIHSKADKTKRKKPFMLNFMKR